MPALHLAISAFLREHGVRRGEPILCAVSGGADSSALVCALAALGQRVGVAHVHHGLRPEAERELEAVVRLGSGLGLPVHVARVDARRRDACSPEERARLLRYTALEGLRSEQGYGWIATAHSEDDQAETLLLRAIRGSGLGGLAGIAPIDPERRLLRPLLGVSRATLRAYLRARRVEWCEDASNARLEVPRNRLRAEVLPRLEEIHPGATRKLAALAAAARRSGRMLEREAREVLARLSRLQGGDLCLDARELRALEAELRARVLLRLLAAIPGARAASRVHLVRIERMLGSADGKQLSLPGGYRLVCRGHEMRLGPAGSAAPQPNAPSKERQRRRAGQGQPASESCAEGLRPSEGPR